MNILELKLVTVHLIERVTAAGWSHHWRRLLSSYNNENSFIGLCCDIPSVQMVSHLKTQIIEQRVTVFVATQNYFL